MSNQFYEQVNTRHEDPVFIVESHCPGAPAEGACEFCSGSCSSLSIAKLNNGTMEDVGIEEAREIYKKVEGRRDRIKFWHVLKELEEEET